MHGYVTVIGIHLENNEGERTVQLVGSEISPEKLLDAVDGVSILYTYNGTRFDLPFIRENLGVDLVKICRHKDLMFECWNKNLYGGLKAVEIKLGIMRGMTDIDGRMAVELWVRYKQHGDKNALETLLKYNREDVENLKIIRRKLEL